MVKLGSCWFLVLVVCLADPRPGSTEEVANWGKISGKVTGGESTPRVVYLEGAPNSAPPNERLRINQRDSSFDPEFLIGLVGQTVEFPNHDKHYHNVFSLSPGNQFDLGLYRGGVTRSTVLRTPGEVEVFCNVHESMTGRILVVPNHFYATVAIDGTYSIGKIPPGNYNLVAWSASYKADRKPVQVRPGVTATLNFQLRRTRGQAAHSNKFGESYGRYQ